MNKSIATVLMTFIFVIHLFSMENHNQQLIISKAHDLVEKINQQSGALKTILSEYQTHCTTDYEIERSIRTLKGINNNIQYLASDKTIASAAVVLPSNLPLYSLVVFGLIPSFMAGEVNIRPNALLQEKHIVMRMSEILNLNSSFPNVKIVNAKEHVEFKPYFEKADLIVFTGNPVHAEKLSETMKKGSVLVVNGSGHNPVVVTETANIDKAIEKTIHLKGFNGGQDCAGPDAILIQESISKEFIEKFKERFASLKSGSFSDCETMIGPIERESELDRIHKILVKNRKDISSGGCINYQASTIVPTVIVRPIDQNPNYTETFSPIAFIHPYEKDEDLKNYFNDKNGSYQSNRMYVTLFGNSHYVESRNDDEAPGKKGNVGIVLKNKTIHDVEIGYEPYGGYSFGASYVLKKTTQGKIQKAAMPILIPHVIAEYLIQDKSL